MSLIWNLLLLQPSAQAAKPVQCQAQHVAEAWRVLVGCIARLLVWAADAPGRRRSSQDRGVPSSCQLRAPVLPDACDGLALARHGRTNDGSSSSGSGSDAGSCPCSQHLVQAQASHSTLKLRSGDKRTRQRSWYSNAGYADPSW